MPLDDRSRDWPDDLSARENRLLDTAERLGRQATRLNHEFIVLTPTKIDRLAEENAKRYISHNEFPLQKDYLRMAGMFIRVFVDAYATYVRTTK